MKLFRRPLNISILNAMIIYRSNTGKKIGKLSVRIELIEGLFVKYAKCWVAIHQITHFISKIPPTEKKARPQRRCVLCQNAGRGMTLCTRDACAVGFYIEFFRNYHTQLNFKGNTTVLFIILITLLCPKKNLK
jgi:hypothetical protein